MAVFDATQNQVLFSPVSNFYQGKAIRAGLREQEVDIQSKEKALEQADTKLDLEERRVELSEEQIKLREEQLDLSREQFEAEVGEEAAKKAAFNLYGMTREINGAFEAGGKTPEAEAASLELAAQRFTEYADSLPEGESKAKLVELLQGGVTPDEYRATLAAAERAAAYYGFSDDDKEENPFAKINPKDFTPESVKRFQETNDFSDLRAVPKDKDKTPDAKPLATPMASEVEIVEEISSRMFAEIEDQPGMDYDFDGSDKDAKQKIKRWIGEEAEAIQRFEAKRGREVGFNSAAEVAAADAKKFIRPPEDPGLFSDDHVTWEPSPYKRGDRITGTDGRTYIVTGYGEDGEPIGEPVSG